MQIHEIFRPRTNESILKGVANKVGAVAGAVASNLGGQILAKAGLDANTGLGTSNPFGDKEAEAAKAAEPLIRRQADDLYKKWVSVAGRNNPPPPAALKQSLDHVVHNILLQSKIGKDYTEINNWVDVDPAIQREAAIIEQQISSAMNSITNAKQPADTADAWLQLVRATNKAMQMINFHPNKRAMPEITMSPTGWKIGNTSLDPMNYDHALIIQILNAQQQQQPNVMPKLKQTPQGIMIGTQLIGKNHLAYKALTNII